MKNEIPGMQKRVSGRVLRKAHGLGIYVDREALRLAVLAMLGGYDKAVETLLPGSGALAIVQGAFGQAPDLARRIAEEAA